MVCGSFFIVPMPITDIVDAVSAPYTVWRTLRGIEPLCHNGRATFVTGNAAVTFTVMHEGRKKILKCYTRSNPYLREIYGSKYYPKELCVIAPTGSQMWVDCLLYDYIEGISLDEAICAARDCHDIALLAKAFDTMACHILADSTSHGDLKPDNIIVTPSMEMIPIDYDSAFTPSLAGKPATEVGTAGYQHPARDTRFFDKHLDDYSIAIISTLLHIAATDFSVVENFRDTHENPLQPRDIIAGKCPYLSTHTEAFARRGDAIRYRIASMLTSAWPRLFNLESTLRFTQAENLAASTEEAYLDEENGLWGCRNDEGWIIPPLYDSGFDPAEGYMIAMLGGYAHLISITEGKVVHSFEKGIMARSVSNGEVVIRDKDGNRTSIALKSLLAD